MKAKEYAQSFKSLGDKNWPHEEYIRLVRKLFGEMIDELKSIAEMRHIASYQALDSLKKEFNQKGNAISKLLGEPLRRDWFLTLCNQIDEKDNDQ